MISGTRIRAARTIGTYGRRTTKAPHVPQMPFLPGFAEGRSRPGRATELMCRPASAINAGSRVMAASTAVATATAAV